MSQEFRPIDAKHCYTCIQWDGQRTWYAEKKLVKVDEKKEGLCRVLHKNVKGDYVNAWWNVVNWDDVAARLAAAKAAGVSY